MAAKHANNSGAMTKGPYAIAKITVAPTVTAISRFPLSSSSP
jgi:hypothetical protein